MSFLLVPGDVFVVPGDSASRSRRPGTGLWVEGRW